MQIEKNVAIHIWLLLLITFLCEAYIIISFLAGKAQHLHFVVKTESEAMDTDNWLFFSHDYTYYLTLTYKQNLENLQK